MVKWRGRQGSRNIEDRRGSGASGAGGLIFLLLRMILSRFGIGGVVLLVGGFFVLSAIGVNPLALVGGQPPSAPGVAADDDASSFTSVILAETEAVWEEKFAALGGAYQRPTLVLFSGQVNSACGYASAAVGPFYCPGDQKVYLDTSFFSELSQRFGAPGDFAGAYVIAHEVGHHVQQLTGVADDVARQRARVSEEEGNALQVRMELQADCYAGVWAHSADHLRGLLDEGDIDEGLNAAAAIGDDTLQRNAGRRVTPESFTHGSSAQRARWFRRGYESGDPGVCDTFGGPL